MKPAEALKTIGLSDKESAIYLACLELGQTSITNISKKANIKRPTTYLILDSLINKGLISTSTKGKRAIYGAEDPIKFNSVIAEKNRALATAMPFLNALNNQSETKPQIRFYEGERGIKAIYSEIFNSKEIRWWGSIVQTQEKFTEILDWFIKISKNKKVYDLLADTEINKEFATRVAGPNYKIRFFPKGMEATIDSALFENKLAMIAFEPEFHGLIIESQAISSSFRTLWELAWRSALEVKDIENIK